MSKHMDSNLTVPTTICCAQIKKAESESSPATRRFRPLPRWTSADQRVFCRGGVSQEQKNFVGAVAAQQSYVGATDAACFSGVAMFLDVATCVIFSLAAALFAALAAFSGAAAAPPLPSDHVRPETDAYLFFLLSSLVPLGAVALYGASTRRSQAVARFGLFYGAALAVGATAVAGATVGPSMGIAADRENLLGGDDVSRAIALALESAVMVVFGAYVGYRCYYLRRRCVNSTSATADFGVGEEKKDALADSQQQQLEWRRAALLSEKYDASELLTAHFRHALAWAQASTIIIVAMDINSNGGPVARPALACALATSMILPLFQEMLLASIAALREEGDPELSLQKDGKDDFRRPSATQRGACVLYVVLTLSSAVCQFAAGLVMPLIRLAIGLAHKRHADENSQQQQQNWMHRICGTEVGVHSDCTALALRTYLAICASIVICAYGAYVYARIAMNVGNKAASEHFAADGKKKEKFGDRCKIWCNTLCGIPICASSSSREEWRPDSDVSDGDGDSDPE